MEKNAHSIRLDDLHTSTLAPTPRIISTALSYCAIHNLKKKCDFFLESPVFINLYTQLRCATSRTKNIQTVHMCMWLFHYKYHFGEEILLISYFKRFIILLFVFNETWKWREDNSISRTDQANLKANIQNNALYNVFIAWVDSTI